LMAVIIMTVNVPMFVELKAARFTIRHLSTQLVIFTRLIKQRNLHLDVVVPDVEIDASPIAGLNCTVVDGGSVMTGQHRLDG
jgi:hypothetical protein